MFEKNPLTLICQLILIAAVFCCTAGLYGALPLVLAQSPATNSAHSVAPANTATNITFSWPISDEVTQVHTFQLIFDNQVLFQDIANKPTITEQYKLTINPQQLLYQFTVLSPLPTEHHTWQVIGYDRDGQPLTQTDPKSIEIVDNSQLGLLGYIGSLVGESNVLGQTLNKLIESGQLLILGLSSVLYVVISVLQFSQILTVGAFAQALEAFGLVKINNPQGTVFDSQTYEPVPFAIITVENIGSDTTDAGEKPIQETLVSGSDGMYRGVQLLPGMYRFKVKKDGFSFPTLKSRSPSTPINDYYKGEAISVGANVFSQQLMIPMDSLEGAVVNTRTQKQRLVKNRFNFFVKSFRKSFKKIILVLFIVSILAMAFKPTIFNGIVLSIYTVLTLATISQYFRRPLISGRVFDEATKPMLGVIVRLTDIESNQLVSVSQSNAKGEFKFFVKKGRYQIDVFKNNYLRDSAGSNDIFSLNEIDATQRLAPLSIKMHRVTQTVEEFFAS